MTTGRINQVCTVGGACARRAPSADVRAGGEPPRASSAGTWPRPRRLRALANQPRSRSERRHASSRGAPLGTVRPRTVTWTKACDPSATASALPLRWHPPRKHLQVTRRLDATRRRTGARIRTPLAGDRARTPGTCGAEGRRGAGGISLASRNASVSHSPPFSVGWRGAAPLPCAHPGPPALKRRTRRRTSGSDSDLRGVQS